MSEGRGLGEAARAAGQGPGGRTRWSKAWLHWRSWAAVLGALAVEVLLVVASYQVGRQHGQAAASQAAGAESKASMWTCSMHPQIQLPSQGKCPICFMDLIPLEEEGGNPDQLKLSPAARALAGIEVTRVSRRWVTNVVRMVGKVTYDETRLVDSTAWVAGRLDRLYVDYTGVEVRRGDHLFHIYSPQLVVAQDELLLNWQAYRRSTERNREEALRNLRLSEEKLRLWGLLDEQIEEIKRRGTSTDHVTIYAPVSGIVIRKHCNEGAYVREGTPVYTIADLSQVWVYLDAYESDLPWIRYGQEVEFTTESYPGEVFRGRIAFIDPVLTERTRTVRVRVNVPNADYRLKPGMFVHAVVRSRLTGAGRVLEPSLAGKWICPMHPDVVKQLPEQPLGQSGLVAGDGQPDEGQVRLPIHPTVARVLRAAPSRTAAPRCDRCGMEMVRAERIGFVASETGAEPPLAIPATAPLITGTRAVVYVQVDPALLQSGEIHDWEQLIRKLRDKGQLSEPSPAKRVWDLLPEDLKNKLLALPDPPVPDPLLKIQLLDGLNALLDRSDFYDAAAWAEMEKSEGVAPLPEGTNLTAAEQRLRNRRLLEWGFQDEIARAVAQPTFEGREVVLGPRAGDYYIVRHGLAENELVVTQGNFKIDSALQIKARPSMMNPEPTGPAPEPIEIPSAARMAMNPVYQGYLAVAEALAANDLARAHQAALGLVAAADAVDGRTLGEEGSGHWKRLANQAIFAAYGVVDAEHLVAARLAFDPLSQAVLALVETFGHGLDEPLYRVHCPMAFDGRGAEWLGASRSVQNPYFGPAMSTCGEITATYESLAPLEVPLEFRRQLAGLYQAYLALHEALADDRAADAATAWKRLGPALAAIQPRGLDGRARRKWDALRAELEKHAQARLPAEDIEAMRGRFERLAAAMLELVDQFGHAQPQVLAKAHCPMAFDNRGAPWLQAGTELLNPYFGHKMLHCGKIERTFPPAGGTVQEERP
ncbi:MAG TPA: efflux RND transporter periplasmic adaptor subunit [Planctomycetes bacterium]|nr:efflux RND transporter periplasmic adaptor subunit [Planctomycetota bacterium]